MIDEVAKLRYTLQLQDVVAFNRYHYQHSASAKRTLATISISAALAIFSLSIYFFHVYGVIIGALLAGMFVFLFRLQFRLRMDSYVRRQYEEGANKSLIGWHELEIQDDTLAERNAYGGQSVRLNAIEKIASTPDYAFIYFGAMIAFVVPRIMVTEGNFDDFIRTLTTQGQDTRPKESA